MSQGIKCFFTDLLVISDYEAIIGKLFSFSAYILFYILNLLFVTNTKFVNLSTDN